MNVSIGGLEISKKFASRFAAALVALGTVVVVSPDILWPHGSSAQGRQSSPTATASSAAIDFSQLRNKPLTESLLNKYIDPRIQGQDRVMARFLMRKQVPSLRANFLQQVGNKLYSNVYDILYAARHEKPIVRVGKNWYYNPNTGNYFPEN